MGVGQYVTPLQFISYFNSWIQSQHLESTILSEASVGYAYSLVSLSHKHRHLESLDGKNDYLSIDNIK